jgi:hypothetical protein
MGYIASPLVSRVASTQVVFAKKLLLRAPLESRCADPLWGGPSAPSCYAPETCVSGVCRSPLIDPKTLPPYTASWSTGKNDICKADGGGAPTVIVGQGQGDYLPSNDLDVAQVEAGPQGGHHIWIALRVKNLLQSGSITKVTGRVPELNLDISPLQVIFTFDQDEGGYCKLYGLRFQLDQTNNIEDLLGKVLEITAQVSDKDGDIGIGKRTVTLSSDIL